MTFWTLIRWKENTLSKGLTEASGAIAKLGIYCARDWPIFLKWLFNASAISPCRWGENKVSWFDLRHFGWFTLPDWSSLINRQVIRGSLLFASRFSEKYLRLAFFNELLALFPKYVCGKYVVVAINSVRSIIPSTSRFVLFFTSWSFSRRSLMMVNVSCIGVLVNSDTTSWELKM